MKKSKEVPYTLNLEFVNKKCDKLRGKIFQRKIS